MGSNNTLRNTKVTGKGQIFFVNGFLTMQADDVKNA